MREIKGEPFDLGDETHYQGNLTVDTWDNLKCWDIDGLVWTIDKEKALQLLAWLKEQYEEEEEA